MKDMQRWALIFTFIWAQVHTAGCLAYTSLSECDSRILESTTPMRLGMESMFTESPFTLTLTFEFVDEATMVSIYRNYNLMESHTYEVYDGFTVSYDCSAYGDGDYVVAVSPMKGESSLISMIGIGSEDTVHLDTDVSTNTDPVNQGTAFWEQDFGSMDNLMMVHRVPKEAPDGYIYDPIRQNTTSVRSVPCRSLSRLYVPSDNSWVNFHGRGLYTWEGSCAALDSVKKGDVVEIIYDSEVYNYKGEGYTRLRINTWTDDADDNGITPRVLSTTAPTKTRNGHAVVAMDVDGPLCFGLSGAGAIRKIIIYRDTEVNHATMPSNAQHHDRGQVFDYGGRLMDIRYNEGIVIQKGKKKKISPHRK